MVSRKIQLNDPSANNMFQNLIVLIRYQIQFKLLTLNDGKVLKETYHYKWRIRNKHFSMCFENAQWHFSKTAKNQPTQQQKEANRCTPGRHNKHVPIRNTYKHGFHFHCNILWVDENTQNRRQWIEETSSYVTALERQEKIWEL